MSNKKSNRPHSTVEMTYHNETVEIDEALAPLIAEIWKAGIGTVMCCQETDEGIAWIEFESVDDLLKFLNIVTRYEIVGDSIYNRASTVLEPEGMTLPGWEYQLNLVDIAECDPQRAVGSHVLFEATVGAYFPQEDIPRLLSKLREFNANRRVGIDRLLNCLVPERFESSVNIGAEDPT